MTLILGADTGFANFGWAVLEALPGSPLRLVDAGHIETHKASKLGRDTRQSEDSFARAQYIARELAAVLDKHTVAMTCYECISIPQRPAGAGKWGADSNTSVTLKMGLGFGVLAAACEARGIPTCSASPQEIKLAVTGGRSASKAEMMSAIDAMGPISPAALLEARGVPRSKQDHSYDAVGAILACQHSDLFRLAAR